jgi:Kef-type K+ transport system membrane component KefB
LAYPVLVGLPLLGLAGVLVMGRGLDAPDTAEYSATPGITPDPTFHLPLFLAQVLVIVAVSRLLGKALRRFGQPQVVGEMLTGIVLGRSVLGILFPDFYHLLLPVGSVRFIYAVSQLGLLVFMFLVGLELDPGALKARSGVAVLTSHVSIVTPLFFGGLVSLVLYPRVSSDEVSFVTFALFVGTALSVTAFPVLARLLIERRLERTGFGTLALACAAVDDVTAWCLLAAVTALAHKQNTTTSLITTGGGLALYVLGMRFAVRPLLRRIAMRVGLGTVGQDGMAFFVVLLLGSAWVTDHLGVHALFGAFMMGVIMPRELSLAAAVRQRSEDFLLVLGLPLFFAATGIRMNLALLGGDTLPLLGLTILAAVAGKLGGTMLASRAAGMEPRHGVALGALLNARGLIGLVVVSVGLEAHVISQTLYVILMITMLFTTFMAAPVLSWAMSGSGARTLVSEGSPVEAD